MGPVKRDDDRDYDAAVYEQVSRVDIEDVRSESAYSRTAIGCHAANERVGRWHRERVTRMRQWTVLLASSLILFSGCDSSKKPNETNLRSSIDQYLLTQTLTCVAVDGRFPLDVPVANLNDKSGEAAELAALEHVGLVQPSNTTAVVQTLESSLSLSPHKAQPVKRYTVSGEGQKYFQRVRGTFGQSDGFCYGHEKVDRIVNWTEPQTQGDYSETTVTYTYKIPDLAAWARPPEVEQVFPTIGATLGDAGKNQTVALHLTEKGWVVNGL